MIYVIHRIIREPISAVPGISPDQWAIKLFPIKENTGEPLTVNADSHESAFALAKLWFPYLRFFLAVQPLEDYRNDLARFAASEHPRGKAPRLHRPAETSRA